MDDFEQSEYNELIERFKKMVEGEASFYFDSEEMEIIINEVLENFDLPLAEKAIKYAIKTYPTESYFRLLKVRLLILDLSLEEAEEELAAIESSFPLTHEFYLEKAMLSRLLEKDDNIMEWLEKALILAPEDPDVLFSLTYESIHRNEIDQAIKYMEMVLEVDRTFEEQLFSISYLLEENTELDKDTAIKFFTALTNKYPLCIGAWFALAVAYSSARQFEKAIEANLYVLSIDDKTPAAYYNIGNAYFEMAEYEKAREAYLKSVEENTNDDLALNAIAYCYKNENNETKALEYFQKSFNINENNLETITGIIAIYINLKKTEELFIFINKAIEIDGDSYKLFSLVAPYLIEEQHIEQLKYLFHSSLNQMDDREEFIYSFGELCCEKKYYDIGIELLEHYIDDEEVIDILLYVLAALYLLNNQPEEGEKFLELALITNFTEYPEFLALQSDLKDNPSVKKLIELHNPF